MKLLDREIEVFDLEFGEDGIIFYVKNKEAFIDPFIEDVKRWDHIEDDMEEIIQMFIRRTRLTLRNEIDR